jgi:hypothetical protein
MQYIVTTKNKTIMKKTTKLFLSVGCLTALSLITSQAAILANGDFELTTVHTPFFDATGAIVPGAVPDWTPLGVGVFNWSADGTGPGDSGIDVGLTEPYPGGKDENSTHMYLAATDPAIANVSTTPVGLNTYQVSFDLNPVWSSMNLHDTLVTLYADVGGVQTVIATDAINGLGDLYANTTYTFDGVSTLTAGNVAVSFQNDTPIVAGQGSYTCIDNVSIQVVPEPGTIALLTLGGLGALVAIRRRRA